MDRTIRYVQYGYTLAQERKNAGLLQKEVAKELGVKDNVVSYFENGDRLPSIEQYKKLSQLFNVSTDYLLGLSPYPEKQLKEIHPQAICRDCTHHSQMPGEENIVYCKQFFATMPNDGWCCYGKEEKKCSLET